MQNNRNRRSRDLRKYEVINMKIKISILLIILLMTIVPTSAFDFEVRNCDQCHKFPPVFLSNTVSISNINVAPDQKFTVTITWTGGATAVNTISKWPTVGLNNVPLDNAKFNPTPLNSTVGISPTGTLTSTLTAPKIPGSYTLNAYTSDGTGAPNNGMETVFKNIIVTVQPPQGSAINLTKTPSATEVTSGTSVTYTYVVTNTGGTTLSNVLVTDDKLGAIGGPITLATGANQTFTKSQVITADTTNVGTATGTSGTTTVTSTAPATVTIPQAPTIFEISGATAADIKPTVDSYRKALGDNNGVGKPSTKGRRQIDWDAVPDKFSAPNFLPANFFNKNSPRGAVFTTKGKAFQVSANSSNPTNTRIKFGNINPALPGIFSTFSPQRLFTALESNIVIVRFFVPGTGLRATVNGFGAVFTDVNDKDSTKIEYFDVNNKLLFSKNVLSGPTKSLSFLGIRFNASKISKVRITSGNRILKDTSKDTVVMDDFIYGEPQTFPSNGNFLNFSEPDVIGTNNDETATAYYAAIDPTKAKDNFVKWKKVNGFDKGDDAKTFYFNANDLGFGRGMFMKKGACDTTGCDIAYYVSNYPTVDDARLNKNLLATVAMDYSKVTPSGPRFTKFYIFDKNNVRINSVKLDDFGNKFLPNMCVICHSGTPKSDAFVKANGYTEDGNINASFIPFDLESFTYSKARGFDRNGQESAFKKMNIGILDNTGPSAAVEELIKGWYGDTLSNPKQNSKFVPTGWAGKENLYNTVIKTTCRSCHIMLNSTKTNAESLNFTTFESLKKNGAQARKEVCISLDMPNAELTFENFWYGTGPFKNVAFGARVAALANGSLTGWSPSDKCPQ